MIEGFEQVEMTPEYFDNWLEEEERFHNTLDGCRLAKCLHNTLIARCIITGIIVRSHD